MGIERESSSSHVNADAANSIKESGGEAKADVAENDEKYCFTPGAEKEDGVGLEEAGYKIFSKSIVITLDIEARGPSAIRHGISAIGAKAANVYVLHHKDSGAKKVLTESLDSFFVALEPLTQSQRYEKKCFEEFWDRNEENRALRLKLEKEAIDAFEGILKFHKWLADIEKRENFTRIVGDAIYYDISMINFYFDWFGLAPLHFKIEPLESYLPTKALESLDVASSIEFVHLFPPAQKAGLKEKGYAHRGDLTFVETASYGEFNPILCIGTMGRVTGKRKEVMSRFPKEKNCKVEEIFEQPNKSDESAEAAAAVEMEDGENTISTEPAKKRIRLTTAEHNHMPDSDAGMIMHRYAYNLELCEK